MHKFVSTHVHASPDSHFNGWHGHPTSAKFFSTPGYDNIFSALTPDSTANTLSTWRSVQVWATFDGVASDMKAEQVLQSISKPEPYFDDVAQISVSHRDDTEPECLRCQDAIGRAITAATTLAAAQVLGGSNSEAVVRVLSLACIFLMHCQLRFR